MVALLVGSVACSSAATDPAGLVGANGLGANALGPPLATPAEVGEWVREKTGQCDEVVPRTMEEFTDFVGPLRAKLYAPHVAEWATCAAGPYERLGLVVFRREQLKDFQQAWQAAMASGEVSDNPDFGFGNGFALSGTLGLEVLGLHELRCTPVEPGEEVGHTQPAEAEGCTYVQKPGHHH
ncbi:hypothetical protein LZG04_30800 [Saccharothrix sp. S26]|uniref:hypothetical protein n=1 Tax=Saccharothrix sp. S26 TaxID=2907215 RepID=UPI001F45BD9F|nr:hypothetical protein [Saccharothrix sp. S26]MCE6999161.1 hypothetical protein [Saccharothrix sp. S26]